MPFDYIFVFMLSFTTLIVVIFKVMHEDAKKKRGGNDQGGGGFDRDFTPPRIDLPPGVCWPDEVTDKKLREKLFM